MNCQYLSFNLGSTNGNLNVTNLASQSIFPLQGNVAAWSAVWTNNTFQIIANYAATTSTNNVNVYVPANITNTTVITYYVLVVDASALSEQVPVTVQNLTLHSTNIVVSDSMTVENSLLLDGTKFHAAGGIGPVRHDRRIGPAPSRQTFSISPITGICPFRTTRISETTPQCPIRNLSTTGQVGQGPL